jgi:aerobic carbon-monoxide dehydrogenase small subunit
MPARPDSAVAPCGVTTENVMKQLLRLTVNGTPYEVAVYPWRRLSDLLREDLRLTGTKKGCGQGDCGACTVLLNGVAVVSCLTLALEAEGGEILTIEGLAGQRELLHPIQQAFVDKGAVQCGFCTPGMVLSTLYLLSKNPDPTEGDIRAGLSGNLCRCTGYVKIVEAIKEAACRLRTSHISLPSR